MKCFLRFFERHVINHDHIFNFDGNSLSEFLEEGVFLNANVIEGNIGNEKTQAEVLKTIAQDSCALVIGYFQPVEIKNRYIALSDKVALGVRNVNDIVEVYDNIRQKEGKWLNVRQSFIECEKEKPETIVLSIKPNKWNYFYAQDIEIVKK